MKPYEEMQMEIIYFDDRDIITSSVDSNEETYPDLWHK